MSDPHFITTADQIKHPNRKKHTHTGSAWLLACPANRTKVFFRWQIRDGRHQEAARAVCNDTQASDEIVLQWYAIYPMWSSDRCRNGLLVLMFSPSETPRLCGAVSGLSKWGGVGAGAAPDSFMRMKKLTLEQKTFSCKTKEPSQCSRQEWHFVPFNKSSHKSLQDGSYLCIYDA